MSSTGTKSWKAGWGTPKPAPDPVPLYAKVAVTGDPDRLLRHAIEELEALKHSASDNRRKQIEESLRLLRSYLPTT